MRTKPKPTEDLTWWCSACGAENNDSLQVCNECGGARAGDVAMPRVVKDEDFEKPGVKPKTKSEVLSPKPGLPEPDEENEDEAEDLDEAKVDEDIEDEPETAISPPVVTSPFGVDRTPSEPEPVPEPELFSPTPSPASSSAGPTIGQGRYFLVFVNTPAQSLIKSKVPVEFDDFPVITIGRSPENVLVIPDQEVSRKHAELTISRNKLVLKDLNSKNGTYVYNGKEFQQVRDSVEVKPNSLIKFGTGTIVRLTIE